MIPRVEGQVHTFAEHGLYDGLFLMRDEESGTFWDHLTGEAVYGPRVGERLDVGNLLQTSVGEVMDNYPNALIALSDRALRTDDEMRVGSLLSRVGGRLSRMFRSTVKEEDGRRPTMDIGMGIWSGDDARYYPYETVLSQDKAILDEFMGRKTLVFIAPGSNVLSAFYVDTDSVWWDEKTLRLANGRYISGGVLFESDGSRAAADRPLQIFTRWYGFSLTFPKTGIFGEGR